MAASTIIDKKLKARLDSLDKIRTDLLKEEKSVSTEIMNSLKQLMANNPLIEGIMWRQYIPSFNDGDACEFTLSGPYVSLHEKVSGLGDKVKNNNEDDDGEEYHEWLDIDYELDDEYFEKRTDLLNFKDMKELKTSIGNVRKAFEHLFKMEDVLKDMFNDGTEIVVTKDGVETDDYYDE